jgi:predicted HicB family RNase H-like nuclease
MDKKMFSTRIEPSLHKAIKMLAVEEEKPVSELVEESFRDVLKKHGKKPPKID